MTPSASAASIRSDVRRTDRTPTTVARRRARRVVPGGDPRTPAGGRRSSSPRALRGDGPRSYGGPMLPTNVIETSGLGKRYGERIVAVDGLDLRVRRGRGLRLPRAQRRRQDDDAAHAARARPADVGQRARPRPATGVAGGPVPHRLPDRDAVLLPVPVRTRQPAGARAARGRRGDAHLARPGRGGARGSRRRSLRHVLPGHEAAARDRRGAAQGPRPADPRRADQRHGPRRHGRDAQLHPRARRRPPHRPPLQPPDGRGRAGLRPGRRDQPRPAGRRGDGRRATRPRAALAAGRAARRGGAPARPCWSRSTP